MQVCNLILKNYKQYNDTNINFAEGLTGFIGNNGSGKSTLLEAIAYALYGKCTYAKEDIRNDNAGSKEPVEVELTFIDKGREYKVYRSLKGKLNTAYADLYCDGILIASQSSEVNKYIIKLLKIDYKNFKRSYFSEQKDVTALLTMKTGERQVEIRKMLGLEKLDRLEEKVKDEIKEKKMKVGIKKQQLLNEDKIQLLEKQKAELDENKTESEVLLQCILKELNLAKEEYQKAKSKVADYEIIKDKHQKLEKELSVTRSRIADLEKQIKASCDELSELNYKKQQLSDLFPLKEKYDLLNEELGKMLSEQEKYTRRKELCSATDVLRQSIEEKYTSAKFKENEISEILPLQQKLNEQQILFTSKSELVQVKNELRDSVKDNISTIESQLKLKKKRLDHIKQLGKDSACPECERPLNEHYDKLVSEYEIQIAEFSTALTAQRTKLSSVEVEIKTLNNEKELIGTDIRNLELKLGKVRILKGDIEQITFDIKKSEKKIKSNEDELNSIGEVSFDPEKLIFLKEEVSTHKSFSVKYNQLSGEVMAIPALENKLADCRSERSNLMKAEAELTDNIKLNNYSEAEYVLYKDECNKKEHAKDELQQKHHYIDSQVKETLHKLNIIINTLSNDKNMRDEINDDEAEINLYDRLSSFINSFKQRIASQEMPAISLEASRLFSNITRGRYSDLLIDNDYEIYVNRDANKVLLSTLSGGEKDLAGLCLRIAISKRIAALAGRENMGFLALDEVFGSQDEARRSELMSALYQISNDFRQIFVISHNEDVKESFPNRLHIRKAGKFSVID